MSMSSTDPSGNTEQFQAFARREAPATAGKPSRVPILVIGAVAAVALLAVVLALAVM
jgi:hypothetical protein